MSPLVALGARLVRAGGALRVVSVVVGCALAVTLLVTAWALPDALYPVVDPQHVDLRRGPLVSLLVIVVVPVLALVLTVGRLSSEVRDRRLASLRLLGVARRQVALVAAVENALPALAGAALGVLGSLVLTATLDVALADTLQAPLTVSAAHVGAVVAGVVGTSVALALASVRRLGTPRAAHTVAVPRRPSWWRLAPLVPTALGFAAVLAVPAGELGDWAAPVFLLATVSGAVSVALAAPLVSYATAGGLIGSGRTGLLLAGRQIQTQAAPISRRVMALGLAVYVVVGGAGLLSLAESATHLRAAIHEMEVGPQRIHVSLDEPVPARFRDELAEVPGVQAVVPLYSLSPVGCDGAEPRPCPRLFVGTCESLSALMVVTGCRDDQPAWIESDLREFEYLILPTASVDVLDVVGADGTPHTVHLTGAITQDVPATTQRWVWPGQDHVFIPADLARGWGLEPFALTVVADAGAEVSARVHALTEAAGGWADTTAQYDYQSVVATRTAAWTVMAVSVGVALLAYGLATVDRAREQRRPRARLVALGVPAALLRRVEGVQNLIPLVTTIVLAAGLGLVATWVLAHTDDQPFALDPALLTTLLGLVAAGAVLVSCATIPLTRRRLRASDLRDD